MAVFCLHLLLVLLVMLLQSGLADDAPNIYWMEIPVVINGGVVPLQFHKHQNFSAVARDFALKHNLTDGAQCPETKLPEGTLTCVVEHVVYDMRLQAMGRELKTGVQGRYYALQAYFEEGRIYEAPQTAVALMSLVENLVGHDDILTTAYTYLQTKSRFVDAAYALANMLFSLHRMGRVHERYLSEARAILINNIGINESTILNPPAGASLGEGDGTCTSNTTTATEKVGSLRVVAVASDPRPELDALLDSAAAVGLDVTVLGLGQPWKGLGSKIKLLQEYLLAQPPEADGDILLFVDAFDVFFLRSAVDFRDRYLRLGKAIVFGAEANAAPDVSMQLLYEPYHRAVGTPPGSRLLYLNSGTFVGPLGRVRAMVNDVREDLRQSYREEEALNSVDDQRWFTRYLFKHPEVVGLDTGASLFQTLHDLGTEAFMKEEGEEGALLSRVTGSTPCLLHGNGNGCRAYKKLVRGLIEEGWPPRTSLNASSVDAFFPKYCAT